MARYRRVSIGRSVEMVEAIYSEFGMGEFKAREAPEIVGNWQRMKKLVNSNHLVVIRKDKDARGNKMNVYKINDMLRTDCERRFKK